MDFNWVNILILAMVVFAWVAKLFYQVFVKPFTSAQPRSGPGRAEAPRGDLREFLEELRRDLGHGEKAPGELPPPRTEGLLDAEPQAARREERTRVEKEDRGLLDREAPAPTPVQRPPTAPSRRGQELPAPPPRPAQHSPAAAPPRRKRGAEGPLFPVSPRLAETGRGPELPTAQAALEAVEEGILGVDLEKAILLNMVLGPPRAFRPYHRRP